MSSAIPTPEGTRDRLFGECGERRRVQSALLSLFQRRGFKEVSTPEVEFYDLFLRSGNPMPQEQLLKIIDRGGKIMVMRPDCTTPIARVHSAKLKHLSPPHRLYYDQTVFRSGQEHRGGRSEIAQCGVELLGAHGLRADMEVLALAADSLRSVGLRGFHIEVGHAGFFHDLTQALQLPQGETEAIRGLIEGKNFAALADFLAPYVHTAPGKALDRLPYLFGGVEVLDEAEALFPNSDAVSYLRQLYAALVCAGYGEDVRFDLGMVHQIDYYTGVVFRGYAMGAADAVLSGGRYDGLLAAFGADAPATGFAVDVDAVAGCLPPLEPARTTLLIHYDPLCLSQALAALDAASSAGIAQLSPCATLEGSRELARNQGVRTLLVIDPQGERREAL